jgi:hypothetical protein
MKSKKYASVEICQNSYRKIIETGVILIVLTDIYITAYIYGFVKALQLKRDWTNKFYGSEPPALLCRGLMFYMCYLYLFTYIDVQHDFNMK